MMFEWLKKLLRNSENPHHPIDDDGLPVLFDGKYVSADTALTLDTVWRAVNLVSGDVARLPLLVYQQADDTKIRATSHPAYKLLKNKSSAWINAYNFKKTLTNHCLVWGNGYAAINRLNDGTPVELIILDPTQTYAEQEGKELWYKTRVGAEEIKLYGTEVFHLKGCGFDGIQGYSVISYAAESIGLGLSLRRYGKSFFDNNAAPNVALSYPGKLKPEAQDNIIKSWEKKHKNVSNSHKVALLQEGMTLQTYTISAEDAQLIDTRKFTVREIANFFGIPAYLLGDESRTSFASLEIEKLSYLDQLDPMLVAWEMECWDKLLQEQEKEVYSVEFLRQALLRLDTPARYNAYKTAIDAGFMEVNEVRRLENLPPLLDTDNGNESDTEPADNGEQVD